MQSEYRSSAAQDEVEKLVRHSEYLRQINSNKAFALQRSNRWIVIATVIVAAAVTFVGFSGTTKLKDQLDAPLGWSQQAIDLAYNSLVLLVLLLTIVSLIYRLPERAGRHEQAIHALTEFIRINDAIVRASGAGARVLNSDDADRIRGQYLSIAATLPPSSDKEFIKAKKDYAEKKIKSRTANLASPVRAVSNATQGGLSQRFSQGVYDDPELMAILRVLEAQEGYELWLTGGMIRNKVWDELHEYRVRTPVDDVDVVWFDKKNASSEIDKRIEVTLTDEFPNLSWDVKNQARMSNVRSSGVLSLAASMHCWPETAAAVAVRIQGDRIVVLDPFGLEDLYGLFLRVPPMGDHKKFEERMAGKGWLIKWPRLEIKANP